MSIPKEVREAVERAHLGDHTYARVTAVLAELEKLGTITVTPHPEPPKTGLRWTLAAANAHDTAYYSAYGPHPRGAGCIAAARAMLEDLIERSRGGGDSFGNIRVRDYWLSEADLRKWLGLPESGANRDPAVG